MERAEFEAGPDHVIVVYMPPDLGSIEMDALEVFAAIAADAAARAPSGQRLLSMTTMPLRHAGAWLGQEGSGYQTKAAIAVVYERYSVAAG